MGIKQTHLSAEQWVQLLKEMPTEGKEVIPQMLQEQRLTTDSVGACDLLLGGVIHAHIGHLMAAQSWANQGRMERRPFVQLTASQPKPEEQVQFEDLGQLMREHLEELRQNMEQFLDKLEIQESKEKVVIGARPMRYAFKVAGWNNEGKWKEGAFAFPHG